MIQILPTLRYNRVMEGSDVKAFGFAEGSNIVARFKASAARNLVAMESAGHSKTDSIQSGRGQPLWIPCPAPLKRVDTDS